MRFDRSLGIAFALCAACTSPNPLAGGDAGDVGELGDTPGPPVDGALSVDAGDAGADGAALASCGDGIVDPGEVCDGDTVACGALAASFAGGTATCRAGCGGYDVAACTLAAQPTMAEVVKPATRDAARFADARCNDGTPFSFEVRLSASKSKGWVVFLQGGSDCDDYAKLCSERLAQTPELVTTQPAADRGFVALGAHGVLSQDPTENPTFATANQVFAVYCSSDAWSGGGTSRIPNSADPIGWYFSGRVHVAAMLETLTERYGLDDADSAQRILFSGGSAGGAGVLANADQVATRLPLAAASGRLKLIADAGWLPPWDHMKYRMGSATTSDEDAFDRMHVFWASTLNPLCVAAVGAADAGTCLMGPVVYPYIASAPPAGLGLPILIQENARDPQSLALHHIALTDSAGVAAWQQAVRDSLAADAVAWLFSGSTPTIGMFDYHTILDSPFWTYGPTGGGTFRDLVTAFWNGGAPQQIVF